MGTDNYSESDSKACRESLGFVGAAHTCSENRGGDKIGQRDATDCTVFHHGSKNSRQTHQIKGDVEDSNELWYDYLKKQTCDNKENATMSFVFALLSRNISIVAVDKRCTTVTINSDIFYEDNQTKIVNIPNLNAVVAATGLAKFGDKSFSEIVASIEASDINSAMSNILQSTKEYVLRAKTSLLFTLFSYNQQAMPIYHSCSINSSGESEMRSFIHKGYSNIPFLLVNPGRTI